MKKEFGHLSREQAKRVYAGLHQYNTETQDLREEARKSDKLDALVIPWVQFYEMPYLHHIALFVYLIGWEEHVKEAAQSDDPQEAFLDFYDDIGAAYDPSDEFDEEEKLLISALIMALMGQSESLKLFSQPLSALIEKARAGDDTALFQAITVDRTVVACPSVAKRISIAQVCGDEAFMDKLAKAITRTKPARPKPQYDDLRLMLEILAEKGGIEQFTTTQLEDILKHELELYPNDSDYSLRAFRKLIQKRNQMVGT